MTTKQLQNPGPGEGTQNIETLELHSASPPSRVFLQLLTTERMMISGLEVRTLKVLLGKRDQNLQYPHIRSPVPSCILTIGQAADYRYLANEQFLLPKRLLPQSSEKKCSLTPFSLSLQNPQEFKGKPSPPTETLRKKENQPQRISHRRRTSGSLSRLRNQPTPELAQITSQVRKNNT